MNLLLDTHLVLWALYGDVILPEKAQRMIINPYNTVYYSVVSTWEVLLKHVRQPQDQHYDVRRFLEGCLQLGFLPLNLCDRHIAAIESLERAADAPEHKDPFDRLLLVQAKTENYLFLTHDSKFGGYEEPCVMLC